MSYENQMTVDERRKYLHKMRIRYWQDQSKAKRSQLLNEMEAVLGLHRKSLIRLIHGDLARKPRRKQRGKTYGAEVEQAVRRIAHSLDYPCAERLQPNLVWMAKHLARHGELEVNALLLKNLAQVSIATVRRMIPPSQRTVQRIAHRKAPRAPRTTIKHGIPMRRIAWEQEQPGHFEVDLVHHCGLSASGQYVHTTQMTDVATGWCECVATLGRSGLVMQDGFQRILCRLPFPVLELHPDNGDEFLNHHLLRFWKEAVHGLEISRSRPYHKPALSEAEGNDNRFVEENNSSLVRAYVGYHRLDTIAQTQLLNTLYDKLWLYHNFFQPVMRLKEKVIQADRIKRIHDTPATPFDRLCATGTLSQETQERLQALRDATNPCQLRREIEQLLDQLFALPCAQEGTVDNVHLTLATPVALALA